MGIATNGTGRRERKERGESGKRKRQIPSDHKRGRTSESREMDWTSTDELLLLIYGTTNELELEDLPKGICTMSSTKHRADN
jgi:hypothetical protein